MSIREEKLVKLIEMMQANATPEDILTMLKDDGMEPICVLSPEQMAECKRFEEENARLNIAVQRLSAESDLWWAKLKESNIGLLNRDRLSIRGNTVYGTKEGEENDA